MIVRFETLFSLAQVHAYYEGACEDLGFLLPPETLRTLRGGKLIPKHIAGRLHVLYEAGEGGAPLREIAGSELRIGLVQRNAQLGNFTEPLVDAALGVARYTNFDDATQLGAPAPLTLDRERDRELLRESAIGVVDIRIDASFYNAPAAFEIALAARQQTLKYYVVARNYTPADMNQLSVADAGFATDARPEIAFTKLDAAAFTPGELPADLIGGSGQRVVLFKSQAAVGRRARGFRRIQLSRNGQVLIESLPQPAAAAAAADVIVHVSKP